MLADTTDQAGRSAEIGVPSDHYCEGAAQLELGSGFFRPESRPSRDLGVLLAALLVLEP